MSNSISILEIIKYNFIENLSHKYYVKLVKKIKGHKEIFDNNFFAAATKNALNKKDVKGILYIAHLYKELKRYVEAEYILFQGYEIDNNDSDLIYYLFDILCIRKELALVQFFLGQLDKLKNNELMFLKSVIKYDILINNKKGIEGLVKPCFDKYKADRELIWLIHIAAIYHDNYRLTYMISKTSVGEELITSLSKQEENQTKKHFYVMIVNILNEIIHDNKNS